MIQHRVKKSESQPLGNALIKQDGHAKILPESKMSYLFAPHKSVAISCQKIKLDNQQM